MSIREKLMARFGQTVPNGKGDRVRVEIRVDKETFGLIRVMRVVAREQLADAMADAVRVSVMREAEVVKGAVGEDEWNAIAKTRSPKV